MTIETIRTADDAITISQTEDRIVTLAYDAALALDLLAECVDHTETPDVHEYWGEDWRVHMLPATVETRVED